MPANLKIAETGTSQTTRVLLANQSKPEQIRQGRLHSVEKDCIILLPKEEYCCNSATD